MSEITQDNLRTLLAIKVGAVIDLISRHAAIPPAEAFRRFYTSTTYRRLECETTKRWHESPAQLFRDYLAGV